MISGFLYRDEITKIRVELLTITGEAIVGNPQLITL
jgi:hypothetical protein